MCPKEMQKVHYKWKTENGSKRSFKTRKNHSKNWKITLDIRNLLKTPKTLLKHPKIDLKHLKTTENALESLK